jgi:aminomethyltransferase
VAHDDAESELKSTPLAAEHEALGARMAPFGGWRMPVQYEGIIGEHNAVRGTAGVFDLSHMGEVEVRGPGALETLRAVSTNNVAGIADGAAIYSPMCLPTGGIVDDLIVYRHAEDRYLLVPNASNIAKDVAWLRQHAAADTTIEDLSADMALVAVQGPASPVIMDALGGAEASTTPQFHFRADVDIAGVKCLVSRTGYTGETGYELYCAASDAQAMWREALAATRRAGGMPVGLGARDTLRLEARLCLYGSDIDETTTPMEAGLGWTVAFDGREFVGRDALARQRADGVSRKLVGLRMDGRGIARRGYAVVRDDVEVGRVTSGAPAPTLGGAIALAYVSSANAKIGRRVDVQVRRKLHAARVVRTPFYKAPATN